MKKVCNLPGVDLYRLLQPVFKIYTGVLFLPVYPFLTYAYEGVTILSVVFLLHLKATGILVVSSLTVEGVLCHTRRLDSDLEGF